MFDKIIVSTDSQEIANIAKEYGAEVPFIRPKKLSDDFTPTAPVLLHALKWMAENDTPPNYVCCIYTTAPFVQPDYLKKGLELMIRKRASSAFSVTTFPFSIFRALNISEAGCLKMFWSEHELARSNDLPEAYHDAGQFYWLDSKKFLKTKKYIQAMHCRSFYHAILYKTLIPRRIGKQQKQCMKLRSKEGYYESE